MCLTVSPILTPRSPWKRWFHIRKPSGFDMVVVRWWNNGESRGVLPMARLRWRHPGPGGWWGATGRPVPPQFVSHLTGSAEGNPEGVIFTPPRAVVEGDFSKWNTPLPSGFDGRVVRQHLDRLNMELMSYMGRNFSSTCAPFCCVDIAVGRVRCIKRLALDKVRDNGPKEAALYDCLKSLQKFLDNEAQSGRPEHPMSNEGHCDAATHNDSPMGEFSALSVDVWVELFSHLDAWDQNRLRAVHPAWNAMLDSPVLTAQIVLAPGDSGTGRVSRDHLLSMMSTVFHCLRPSTKSILLTAGQQEFSVKDFFKLVNVINYVAKHHTGMRLSAVYLVNFRCQFLCRRNDYVRGGCYLHPVPRKSLGGGGRIEYLLKDFIGACTSLPCGSMRLAGCAVHLAIEEGECCLLITPTASPHAVTSRLPLGEAFECALWDALDGNAAVPDQQQLDTLSKWLTADDSRYRTKNACHILCQTQTADPRASSNFREKKWCFDGWRDVKLWKDLKWEQLSRVALHSLIQLMEEEVEEEKQRNLRKTIEEHGAEEKEGQEENLRKRKKF
ncbi:uncharacterized protein LOC129598228 isoform X2 [Paramacrobiotus metropolitanus]|uniref:uncharacterized protein LOC129598228 isoform X2 n=1 Tax=Paramacrobiotus metropolitanus TaxID=2943436 RepID=UPI0024460943|nr:uncharacterized protein LOC129598228 isoform X2 [Paramacrobiotus metropolitanus]